MNEHKRINDMLVDFADARLSQDDAEAVREHLQNCPQCSDQLRRITMLTAGVRELSHISPDAEACKSAGTALFETINEQQAGILKTPGFERKMSMRNRTVKFAAAAAIVIVMLGGITFWPRGDSGGGQWWLGPPAVWGQTIIEQLEKVEVIVHRRQWVFVGNHGQTHVSGTWNRIYEACDRLRTDRYYEDTDESTFGDNSPDSVLQNTTWEVPDGSDLVIYDVSFEHQCYKVQINEGAAPDLSDPLEAQFHDPIRKLRDFVKLMDKAERILEPAVFDGRQCVGFEVAAEGGDGPNRRVDRIWFDIETKLPVRIEKHGMPVSDAGGRTLTMIQDQFEYYADVPAAMFVPEIPEGFIEAEADDIRRAKEQLEKGPMVYAEVPAGLRGEIVTALTAVNAASYSRHSGEMVDGQWSFHDPEKFYICGQSWRRDAHSGDVLVQTRWFVPEKADTGDTSFDFNDRQFRLVETIVNPTAKTWQVRAHSSQSHPDNPMDNILFLADQLDNADSFSASEQVDGVECVAFVLSAAKYGTNPPTHIHRMWFDAETKLPVKLEFESIGDNGPRRTIQDQFQWDTAVDVGMLTPAIPQDFEQVHEGNR